MQGASFDYERSSDGQQAYVRVVGTIDERFDGKQAASRIKSKSVVINCAGVKLITSFGIRSWLDFVNSFEKRKLDLHFVECSPAFVTELNQVVDFTAHGTVVSCYAPYACPSCSAQRLILLRTDLDPEAIRRHQAPEYSCLVCGHALEFDEDPASFFPALEAHIDRPINPKILSFLEARLSYESETHRQLRILKNVSGAATVLTFTGTLDGTLNGERQAQGLQGEVVVDLTNIIHVQQQGLRAFREFLDHAPAGASQLWIVGSPALIIEKALEPRDVAAGVQVASVRVPYHCFNCEGTEFALIDLEGKDGKAIRAGQLRDRTCSGCKSQSKAMVGVRVIETLRQLPEASVPRATKRAIDHASKRIKEIRQTSATKMRGQKMPRWMMGAAIASVVCASAAVAVGAVMLMRSEKQQPQVVAPPQNPETDRPDWIVSDTPNSSYCVDLGWQLQCVGISSYREAKEDAEQEASQAALEAFAHTALLNHESPLVEVQRSAYLKARKQAMSDLEQAYYRQDKRLIELTEVLIKKNRDAVAALLKAQNAAGSPAQRSDSYWEEYAKEETKATEFLAFVRIDVGNAEVKAFTSHYSTPVEVGGLKVAPVIPTIGWLFEAEGSGGFYVDAVADGPFATTGVKAKDIILTTEGDATTLKSDKVTVRRGDKYATETSLPEK